jgi:hypothetical protein
MPPAVTAAYPATAQLQHSPPECFILRQRCHRTDVKFKFSCRVGVHLVGPLVHAFQAECEFVRPHPCAGSIPRPPRRQHLDSLQRALPRPLPREGHGRHRLWSKSMKGRGFTHKVKRGQAILWALLQREVVPEAAHSRQAQTTLRVLLQQTVAVQLSSECSKHC